MKTTTIEVKNYIKERVIKHSKRLELNQNDLIEICLDIAEKNNFINDYSIEVILKNQVKEANRIIGFIKTQDKSLLQIQENIIYKINNSERKISKEDIKEIIDLIQKNYGSIEFLIEICFLLNAEVNYRNIENVKSLIKDKKPINDIINVLKNT